MEHFLSDHRTAANPAFSTVPSSASSSTSPLPLPRLNPPGRRQDGARYADLPTIPAPGMPNRRHPGHGTQAEEDPNNGEVPAEDATPISTQPLLHIATEAPIPTPISGGAKTAEDRSTAMAGLVIALGVAVALLA
ncbi:hypothetical protein F5Y13DRAFT_130497 [Hypoxylon sp. FL1857]|nr:hypothetical protein F5Y13DRAFT_130497 [Hypoxylon sp. FL1857]